ncbi:hypothetical protein KKF81_03720 [Candidatus Micrarchaeota archaeon]|nr:hypothetical protein [Candidatus Micrarchaeota archaeon]MBU1166033.1 hypothetical protein [Candidatus Micrarchaeota archaeon]MBU1886352.1 hypothetical protein [Candidatus Micrarchaeota archaeon]
MAIRHKGPEERDRFSTPVASQPLFNRRELSSMVGVVFGLTDASEHPRNLATVADAAETAMQLLEILRIVTDSNRSSPADQAVRESVFRDLEQSGQIREGEEQTAAAIRIFGTAFITSLNRLVTLTEAAEPGTTVMFGRYGNALEEALRTISTGSTSGLSGDERTLRDFMNGSYANNAIIRAVVSISHQRAMSAVPVRVESDEEVAVPAEEDVEGTGGHVPIEMPQRTFEYGIGNVVTGEGVPDFFVAAGQASLNLLFSYGADPNAQAQANSLVTSLATFSAAYVSGSMRDTYVENFLRDLIVLHERGNEFTQTSQFSALLTSLGHEGHAVDVDEAMRILDDMRGRGNPLSFAIDDASHRYVVSLNQEGITVLRLGQFRVQFDFGSENENNWELFNRMMREGHISDYGFRVLNIWTGMAYDLVHANATAQEYQDRERVGAPIPIEGTAHIGTLDLGISLGTHLGRVPLEIIAHCSGSFGGQTFEAITVPGGPEGSLQLGPQLNDSFVPRIGVSGVEIRIHYPTERVFTLDRVGVMMTGTQMGRGRNGELEYDPNVLGYFTVSFNSPLSRRGQRFGTVRYSTTPLVGMLLDEYRAGGEFNVDFMTRLRGRAVSWGFGARLQYRFGGEEAQTNVLQVEPTYLRGSAEVYPGVAVTVGLGGRFDVGPGGRLNPISSPVAGTVGLEINPGLIRRARRGGVPRPSEALAVVPRPGVLYLGEDVWQCYIEATQFISENEGHLSEPNVQRQAQQHARRLNQAILSRLTSLRSSGDGSMRAAETVSGGRPYRFGMRHLEAGRLDQALQVLGRIPAFSIISQSNAEGNVPEGYVVEGIYLQRAPPAEQQQDQNTQPPVQQDQGGAPPDNAPPVESDEGQGPSARRGRRPAVRHARRVARGNSGRRRRS